MEQWKDIIGYEGLYQVSNYGRIKNRKRLLSPYPTQFGYFGINLVKCGHKKGFKVHRLVALSFLEYNEGREFVNHKDGNKINNSVENLEWVTKSENTKHAYDNGLKFSMRGEKHPMSKLTREQVVEIRKIGKTKLLREIASDYGVGTSMVWYIINNKNWIDEVAK